MKTNPFITAITGLGALACSSLGESPNLALAAAPVLVAALSMNVNAADQKDPANGDENDQNGESITDLKTQLAGTNWKAGPKVRPGLYPTLAFNKSNVEPANYKYQIDTHDFTVRIFFNHGDTQLMLLTDNGRRLGFTFHGQDYSYTLSSR